MVSKQEVIGKEILKRIHIHDFEKGGIFTMTTGAMGSAKTSVILGFCDYTVNHHPNDKVFFSECYGSPLQVFKLQNRDKIVFWFREGVDFVLRDRSHGFIPYGDACIRYFTGFRDLFENAKPRMINVVFFGNRFYWMDFIKFINENAIDFCHVFIDEMAELTPAYQPGELGEKIGDFGFKILKDIRKNLLTIHTNTQTYGLIDWRVRSQVMVTIFLPGARVGDKNRVWQKAVDNLKRDAVHGNNAYLEMSGEFGVTTFTNIYRPKRNMIIDCVCNASGGTPYIINSFETKSKVNLIEPPSMISE